MGFWGLDPQSLFCWGCLFGQNHLLDSVRTMRQRGRDVRLVLILGTLNDRRYLLAQFARVVLLGLSVARGPAQQDAVVHLADTMGEMHALCQCGDFAVVGKAFRHMLGANACRACCVWCPHAVWAKHDKFC